MLIPLGTDRPLRRKPVVTTGLIALTALASMVAFATALRAGTPPPGAAADALQPIVDRFGLVWEPDEPWRFVTYALLHGSLLHLAGNLLFLWVFGPSVEDKLGRVAFAALYVLGAVGAGAAHVATTEAPVIGASGAVAAITGAFLVLLPRTKIRTLLFFILVGVFSIPAAWFIGFAVAKDLLFVGASDNVARVAHLGGYAVGALGAAIALATGLTPRDHYDLFGQVRHAARRREIRGAAKEAVDPADLSTTRPGAGSRREGRAARAEEPALPPELADLRAQTSRAIAARDFALAGRVYRAILELRDVPPKATALGRGAQLELAGALVASGDHALALAAYERFLAAYPTDNEAPHTRVLAALLCARYLNQPTKARLMLEQARSGLTEAEDVAIARELEAELGARVG